MKLFRSNWALFHKRLMYHFWVLPWILEKYTKYKRWFCLLGKKGKISKYCLFFPNVSLCYYYYEFYYYCGYAVEYLLENRVPTSADFNTYPIRILFVNLYQNPTHCAFDAHSLLSSSVKHLIDSLHKSLENRWR